MSAQLAGVIAHADAMGNLEKLWQTHRRKKKRQSTVLKGLPVYRVWASVTA